MKILLLDPEDSVAELASIRHWDLAVDLARAPLAIYEDWEDLLGCRVISLYDFGREIEDLSVLRELLEVGSGWVTDEWGIDWWNVLSLEFLPEVRLSMLAKRLSKEVNAASELYATRTSATAQAIAVALGTELKRTRKPSFGRSLRRRYERMTRLDAGQMIQVCEDKFNERQGFRRHFARRSRNRTPLILLPSAYINVTRTALSLAELLPHREFLLVTTRRNGRPALLPSNARQCSLGSYSQKTDKAEFSSLLLRWEALRSKLINSADELDAVNKAGTLTRFPELLRSGLAHRDAWNNLLRSEEIIGCISADDSNPPTLLPLLLVKGLGLPAVASHHGALNFHMAIKRNQADSYIVKSEIEKDYLLRICRLPTEKIVTGYSRKETMGIPGDRSTAPCLVFFTEPYEASGWRLNEVYRDLTPQLIALAAQCGLKLVFKLHPFETVRGHRKMLRELLGNRAEEIEVIAGPSTQELWRNVRLAITVQSSVALECSQSGIPVFLCGWLRDGWSGYLEQFRRFGVGCVLDDPGQIANIPALLVRYGTHSSPSLVLDGNELDKALIGNHSASVHHTSLAQQSCVRVDEPVASCR